FSPGDLFAECRPERCLVGSAGERRFAAKPKMCFHQTTAGFTLRPRRTHQRRMQQIHRADIQSGRHSNSGALAYKVVDEVQTDLTVIETAVDVRPCDVQQVRGTDRFAKPNQQVHRESGCRSVVAIEETLVVAGKSHSKI